MKQHALRLPDDLAEALDKRTAATGLSRNEQIVRMLRWALAQPVKTTSKTVTEKL
jgi:hypothetical protein